MYVYMYVLICVCMYTFLVEFLSLQPLQLFNGKWPHMVLEWVWKVFKLYIFGVIFTVKIILKVC